MDNPNFSISDLFGNDVQIISVKEEGKDVLRIKGIGQAKALDKTIISNFEKVTGLLFVAKHENGSVCFANDNDDLRDEFKQVFAPADILNYIYGFLSSDETSRPAKEKSPIPYPNDSDDFWDWAGKGKMAR